MGLTQSLESIETFHSYHTLTTQHPTLFHFGPSLQIYKNKFNPKQQFVKHTIHFDTLKEMQHFVQEIRQLMGNKTSNMPFNLLYPVNVFVEGEMSVVRGLTGSCSEDSGEVVVVHRWLAGTLRELVRDNKQGALSEQLVWFIVNELSKSLQLLEENNHASYFLTPQTIFYNQNDNWFIYDGHFVVGQQNLEDFYKNKVKLKEVAVSDDFRKRVESNAIITNFEAIQEDVYCLGYCVIFMMSGVHPKDIPQTSSERDAYVNDLLDALTETPPEQLGTQTDRLEQLQNELKVHKYSSQLVNLVRNLIKPDPKRRFSIRHIRGYLKTKQQQIFMNEEQQWSRTTITKTDSPLPSNKNTTSAKFKLVAAKSPQRQHPATKLSTQYSQGVNPNPFQQPTNLTSLRTLKKQPIPQKLVMINERSFQSKYALSLASNQHLGYEMQGNEGQTTPIRKIDEVRSRNWIVEQRRVSTTTFNPGKEEEGDKQQFFNNSSLGDDNNQHQQQLQHNDNGNTNNLHAMMHSPFKQPPPTRQSLYMSPKKFTTSTIISTNPPMNAVTLHYHSHYQPHIHPPPPRNQLQSPNHMTSPPHHTNFQSPTKVKMCYYSPQKQGYNG